MQIVALASSDLECWIFVGGCNEFRQGCYQLVDFEAVEVPTRFYRLGVFDPEVALPPQLQQLRAELGDEQFAQWLQSNFEQFGTRQGIMPEQVEGFDEGRQEQVAEIDGPCPVS